MLNTVLQRCIKTALYT